jgi:hypothetical protein
LIRPSNRRASLLAAGMAMVLLHGLAMPDRANAQSVYTLVPSQYGMNLKTPDGRVVFQYMTKKPEDIGLTSASVAIFHPVETPAGETITNIAPNDHPHHRGIFFGFMNSEFHIPVVYDKDSPPNHPVRAFNVTRADFWAWGVYAPRDGRLIQNRDIKLISSDAKQAQLEIHNDWEVQGRTDYRKMLDETDEVFVTERDGVYVIDLYYKLAPVVEYQLLQTAFGGFDVQAQKYGDSYYSTASGKVTLPDPYYSIPDSDWPSEPWYDYTIKLKSDAKVVGVAVIDHPLNPPTRWHNSRSLWMLNPCITTFGPLTIEPDAPMILRYRVVVHDGDTPTDVLQKLSQEFRGMQSNPFVHP